MLVVYWLAMFVSTHMPSGMIAHPRAWDKLLHFAAYAGLTFLLAWPVVARLGSSLATYAYLLMIAACYGAVDELAQIPIRGRRADIWDWVADMVGAVAGLVAYRLCLAIVTTLRSQTAGGVKDATPPEGGQEESRAKYARLSRFTLRVLGVRSCGRDG